MRISSIAFQCQRARWWQRLALITLAILGFTVLSAARLSPASSAHGGRSVTQPAGLIFVVNTTADGNDVAPGDGQCDSNISLPGEQCTLRAAIMEANAQAGDDAIRFEIPDFFLPVSVQSQGLCGGIFPGSFHHRDNAKSPGKTLLFATC